MSVNFHQQQVSDPTKMVRAATNKYFHLSSTFSVNQSINCLVHKMSDNREKWHKRHLQMSCLVHNAKTFSLLTQGSTETRKYSHSRNCLRSKSCSPCCHPANDTGVSADVSPDYRAALHRIFCSKYIFVLHCFG